METLLDPWRYRVGLHETLGDTMVDRTWHFIDVPADVAADALALADPSVATGRGNDQPPAAWLVEQARLLNGRVGGSLAVEMGFLRYDTICVDHDQAASLLDALREAWPVDEHHPVAAVDLAEGRAWTSWQASEPAWSGPASQLLGALGSNQVAGLWWD
jgi:hypothetical protein